MHSMSQADARSFKCMENFSSTDNLILNLLCRPQWQIYSREINVQLTQYFPNVKPNLEGIDVLY